MSLDQHVYGTYLQCLLAGQRRDCASIVAQLLRDAVPVRRLYMDLFQASMYEVGELWATHRISVATEHIAAAITEGLLNTVLSTAASVRGTGRKAVVAGVQPELHQLGSRMVADTLEMRGWHTLFVGANTPITDLTRLVRDTAPDIVAFTLTMSCHQAALCAAIEHIRQECAASGVIVGGQGATTEMLAENFAGDPVSHVASLDELDTFLENLP